MYMSPVMICQKGNSISENQIESDSDLEDDLFSLAKDDDDVFSHSDDGAYLSADESLEGTLEQKTLA